MLSFSILCSIQHWVLFHYVILDKCMYFKTILENISIKIAVRDWNTSDEFLFHNITLPDQMEQYRAWHCLSNCIHLLDLLNDHLLFSTLGDQLFYWWSSYRTGAKSYWNFMTNLKIEWLSCKPQWYALPARSSSNQIVFQSQSSTQE